MSVVLVIAATAVYIGMRSLPIYGAFGLFLLPIVLAQVLFGTKSGLAAALSSQVADPLFRDTAEEQLRSCTACATSGSSRCSP